MLGTGADVTASLRNLARKRTDIFTAPGMSEAEKRKAAEEEAKRKAKEREAVVWDGHVASGEMTTSRFQTGANFDEQIKAIHRAKGLTADGQSGTAPKIGPAGPGEVADIGAEPAFNPLMPANGSTLSAAPQAGLINQNAPSQYNPYAQMQQQQPQVPTAAAPAPSTSRAADDQPDGEPNAKRARTSKLPEGQYYDEETWLASHPVRFLTLILCSY